MKSGNPKNFLKTKSVFRVLLPYIARKHTNAIMKNLNYIPEYGRWDDFYSLVGTPVEDEVWERLKLILDTDAILMEQGKSCTLLSKWLKKADASSPNTRKLGIYTAKKLGMSVYD